MKRLTTRTSMDGKAKLIVADGTLSDKLIEQIAIQRLAEYEDAEEQELLVRLPCKAGDTVYVTEPRYYNGAVHTGIQNGKVYGFEFDEEWVVWVHLADDNPHSGNAYPIADIGKTVFFTREAAERALEDANGL